jgi:hypothetical protein
MKLTLISFLIGSAISAALANTAPTPVVVSAAMRPGTTFMDVVYRVNDPDDATVKVRVLAFVDGTRSFANVLRPCDLRRRARQPKSVMRSPPTRITPSPGMWGRTGTSISGR